MNGSLTGTGGGSASHISVASKVMTTESNVMTVESHVSGVQAISVEYALRNLFYYPRARGARIDGQTDVMAADSRALIVEAGR